ncbi:hypothetical protein F5Y13DRAFT_16638 [Hypoxylon sp. FL1857]|nr:hypothetical protein F5Y13DRAFT_16638 [Hypoxylon sp. FL1857]
MEDPVLAHIPLVWMMAQLKPFLEMDISHLWTHDMYEIDYTRQEGGNLERFITLDPGTGENRKVAIKDSKSADFKFRFFTTESIRHPGRTFWNEKGRYIPALPVPSNEYVHFSVRLLLSTEAITTPGESLRGAAAEVLAPNHNRAVATWTFPRRKNVPPVNLDEDELGDYEIDTLRQWLLYEKQRIIGNHTPVGDPPNPELHEIIYPLVNHLDLSSRQTLTWRDQSTSRRFLGIF